MKRKGSFKEILDTEELVLIDFFATWCGPCKSMESVIKDIAIEYANGLKTIKIDIDKNQKLAQQLNIKGVPTFVIYQKGQQVWRKSGAMAKHELTKAIKSFQS
jgi:thioredoxin 1